jgi:hypothetical protein
MEPASCHLYGAYKFEMAYRFLKMCECLSYLLPNFPRIECISSGKMLCYLLQEQARCFVNHYINGKAFLVAPDMPIT